MLKRDAVLSALRAVKPRLEAEYPLQSMAIFGSVARDEATEQSDVDVMVELGPGIGLFRFVHLANELEEILGAKVDLVTKGELKARIRDQILQEAVAV